jgi:hypothetical protein
MEQAMQLAVAADLVSAWLMPDTDKPLVEAEARCACGGVVVTVKGRVLSMMLCACEDCQKATGAGHSALAVFRAGDVTITGETRSFARPSNSGATLTRWFCPTCGTPLGGGSSRMDTITILPVGLLGGGAGWYRPNQLIFARSHHDWDLVEAALPRWQTYRDEEGIR